jgi:hypothetical protein
MDVKPAAFDDGAGDDWLLVGATCCPFLASGFDDE